MVKTMQFIVLVKYLDL